MSLTNLDMSAIYDRLVLDWFKGWNYENRGII